MFTGIIRSVGSVVASRPHGAGLSIEIEGMLPEWDVPVGGSVAINGVCLTLTEPCIRGLGKFDVGTETLRVVGDTSFAQGSRVNLEPALRMGDPLGGHQVSGHVEKQARIVSVPEDTPTMKELWVDIGEEICYVLPKGSITLHGVSLTVNEICGNEIRVNLIAHTLRETNAADWHAGQRLHCELDASVRTIVMAVQQAMVAARQQ